METGTEFNRKFYSSMLDSDAFEVARRAYKKKQRIEVYIKAYDRERRFIPVQYAPKVQK